MRLADTKITLTLEVDLHEHFRLANALMNVCVFAKNQNDPALNHAIKEAVEPFLYFLNQSIPTRATAWGWPECP